MAAGEQSRWVAWTSLLLIGVGLALSIYLTITHYTDKVVLACPETAVVNCLKVTSSSYAYIWGIPLAVLGLTFFVVLIPLYLPAAWRSSSSLIRNSRLLLSGLGALGVFWLVYVELFRLNSICIYCTGVHIVLILLFITTIFGTVLTAPLASE